MKKRSVLPSQDLLSLAKDGMLGSVKETQIQPNSLDLSLGDMAFSMPFASLPWRVDDIQDFLASNASIAYGADQGFVLRRGETVILPLQQELSLPLHHRAVFSTKSTAGRVGLSCSVFCTHPESQNETEDGYHGKLYVQITSLAFNVYLKKGDCLVQARIESPDMQEVQDDFLIHVHCPPEEFCAFRARTYTEPIHYNSFREYGRDAYWEHVKSDSNGGIVLEKDHFYIMKTATKVKFGKDLCADVVSFDERFGSFSNHFAGFIDSGFGDFEDSEGLPIVLEVKPYNTNIKFLNGSPIGTVRNLPVAGFSEMLYSEKRNNYARQGLQLAKQFI